MEALKCSLQQLAKQFRTLPEILISKLAYQTASALAFAHSKGISHLDIKGANLMLSPDGALKVVDWGSATDQKHCEGVRGSPYWTSPEVMQLPSYDPHKVDVWALGATIIELYTG